MPVAIDRMSDTLQVCPYLDLLRTLSKDHDAYIVGGALRDALIGRPITDLDLIFPKDPTSMAKSFARQVGGHWFWLDIDRRQSRVVVNRDDECLCFDFALFRAPDLELDLLDRDFTINAMALALAGALSAASLIDPCHGLTDLQQSSLRMVAKSSLSNDPLRILKGVRHATLLGLEIDMATLWAMQREVAGLDQVAPERIRQEVWKILSDGQADRGLQLLQKSGAGELLFGADFTGSLQKLIAQLEGCRKQWSQLSQYNAVVSDWLAEEVEQGLSVETLLLLTFLSAAINRGLPPLLAEKWRLSRKARSNITAVVALDCESLKELSAIARSERAFSLWAARYHIDPKLLLMALAAIGLPEATSALTLIQAWVPQVARLNDQRPADLVDGHWLRNELGIKAGPEMTKALELLRHAEIYGQVSNKDEAHHFLVEYYQNKD